MSFFIYSLITIIIVVDITIRLPPVIMSPSLSMLALSHDSNHSLHFCHHGCEHFATCLPWVFLYWCLRPIPRSIRFIHKFLSYPFLPRSPSLCTYRLSPSTLWSFVNLIASCIYPNDWSPFLHLIGKMQSPFVFIAIMILKSQYTYCLSRHTQQINEMYKIFTFCLYFIAFFEKEITF